MAERVARLDASARRVVAHCPYTLFNARFEDAAFWRGVAREEAEERAPALDGALQAEPAPPLARLEDGAFALKAFSAAFLAEHWLEFELPSGLLLVAVVAVLAIVKGSGRSHG